jgi:molybdate transport system substrate-binding protein
MRKIIVAVAQFVFLTVFFLCGFVNVSAAQAEDVKIYAAASLTDVITELAYIYKKKYPHSVIKTSFSSSSNLAKQIEHGAPADLFISADQDWMNYLAQRNRLSAASRKNLLTNELVIVAPLSSKLVIQLKPDFNFSDTIKGKLCIGEPAHVPAGKYAQQALDYYGWWRTIQGQWVGAEDVRATLAFVARGECVLGIVYKTDAQLSKQIKVLAHFPIQSHSPIVYPGALTQKAGVEAQKFWQFLQSPEATTLFKYHGFSVAE